MYPTVFTKLISRSDKHVLKKRNVISEN